MRASLALLLAGGLPLAAADPERLTVKGADLVDPSGKSVRFMGVNWQIGREQPGDGALLNKVAPGANMVRLVGVLWGNTPGYQDGSSSDEPNSISECMTSTPPHYFNDDCFEELDAWVRDAASAGLWVVLAVRGEYIAGQDYADKPGTVVFRNETLRTMMYAMWTHVAQHYASFDRIAAYEILSEPRDKAIDAATVNDFYTGGCAAVQSADPRTPCIVGTAPYYKLYSFGESTLIANNANVIYTFDYFNPDGYVFGTSSEITHYNASYPCKDLYKGWSQVCRDAWGVKSLTDPIRFDRNWHARNVATYIAPIQQKHQVPIFCNQWEAVHGLNASQGRYDYMADVMSVFQDNNIGWVWWTYIGGDAGNMWKHGSSELVYRKTDGSLMLDNDALHAMAPFLNPNTTA